MAPPLILQGDSPTRLLQGAALGVILTAGIGFTWGGWTLGSTAKTMADKSAASAVVAALAPICVDQFQRSADAPANLVELKKISSWEQSTFVEKGGWANMPGGGTANSAVAQSCAAMLGSLK